MTPGIGLNFKEIPLGQDYDKLIAKHYRESHIRY
jgi:hypothetical protein